MIERSKAPSPDQWPSYLDQKEEEELVKLPFKCYRHGVRKKIKLLESATDP